MAAMKCVVFRIGNERYALDVQFVANISEYKEITKVPDVRPEVVGVVDLRGEVVPIVNMAERLGSHNTTPLTERKMIIVHYNDMQVGFLVDEASRVLEIDTSDIEAPPAMLKSHDFELIKGILHIENQIVVMLELEHMVALLKAHEAF